jgi:hypothetical protein
VDFLLNAAKGIAQTFSGQNVPGHFKNGKLILDKKVIAQSGRGRKKRVKRRKKQKGKGFIKDLLKKGTKQALRAAA